MRTGGVSTYYNQTGYRVTFCLLLYPFFPVVIPALLDAPEDLYQKKKFNQTCELSKLRLRQGGYIEKGPPKIRDRKFRLKGRSVNLVNCSIWLLATSLILSRIGVILMVVFRPPVSSLVLCSTTHIPYSELHYNKHRFSSLPLLVDSSSLV